MVKNLNTTLTYIHNTIVFKNFAMNIANVVSQVAEAKAWEERE